MRKFAALVLAALAVAACGAGASSTSTAGTGGTSTSSPGSGGKVDCARVHADGLTMSYPGIQVVAGVNDQQSIDDIRNKTGPASSFDINAFLGAVANLHVLDHHSSPGLGDPKAALDDIYAAGLAVKAMVDGQATVPRASFDSFKSKYPTSRLIIQDQSAVAGAVQAAGCK